MAKNSIALNGLIFGITNFELDLDSIKKEADKILEDFEEKYKDFLPEEDLDSKK